MLAQKLPPSPPRILLAVPQLLVFQGLEALFCAGGKWEVLDPIGAPAELGPRLAEQPADVLLIDLAFPQAFAAAGAILAEHRTPTLLLDDAVRLVHVREALRLRRCSYWTKRDPFAALEAAACALVDGKPSWCPAVQAHLVRTSRGMRYRPGVEISPLARLSRRELQVLDLLARGHSLPACARLLDLSPNTVDNHKSRMLKKLGLHKLTALLRLALQEGLGRE